MLKSNPTFHKRIPIIINVLHETKFVYMCFQSVDLVGCHRRSTYPHAQDFQCPTEDGLVKGPPCTAKQGDTFKLHVEFVNLTISDMTQVEYWECCV